VRRDQDRLDEAAALLERAAKSYLLKGMYVHAGKAHMEIGWTWLRSWEAGEARQSFTTALALLGQGDIRAVLRARQGLAAALADAGRREQASDSWSEVRELLAALPRRCDGGRRPGRPSSPWPAGRPAGRNACSRPASTPSSTRGCTPRPRMPPCGSA
ncbi:MAG TPA: hypothetical protein VHN15_14715, partial [Thermoanaerobaculia bacterium]|nr:hypothetical protein [Thermoanaerobaculia bacterium]